jgi:hypothetical protein
MHKYIFFAVILSILSTPLIKDVEAQSVIVNDQETDISLTLTKPQELLNIQVKPKVTVQYAETIIYNKLVDMTGAKIINYYPYNQVIDVNAGDSIQLSLTFKNIGRTTTDFVAKASIFDINGQTVAEYEKSINALAPEQEATVAFDHIVNGDYWLQFRIYKYSVMDKNLVAEAPKPAERLIKGVIDKSIPNILAPFINNGNIETTFVLGDSQKHGQYGWGAMMQDLIGSLGLAAKLGLLADNGSTEQVLDTWMASYDNTNVNINWSDYDNIIVIGGPGVNLITYHYDSNKALPYHLKWSDGIAYIHSDISNKDYTFSSNEDYAVIGLINDNNRKILLIWGLTDKGTVAATQLLTNLEMYNVGDAMIIKWIDDNGNKKVDINDSIKIVESQ